MPRKPLHVVCGLLVFVVIGSVFVYSQGTVISDEWHCEIPQADMQPCRRSRHNGDSSIR
ncbi:MAG: hypothetical protein HOO99_16915 [Hyphomicrobiaceae bacterium]|nr:hypothetical protein [Hyphomicrobiaceae bacterium]